MSGDARPGPFEVPHAKIVDYLLNANHPKGRPKARFFLRFGFDPAEPLVMAEALIGQAGDPATTRSESIRWIAGVAEMRLICEGSLRTRDHRDPRVRTVWMRQETGRLRLVTAVPIST